MATATHSLDSVAQRRLAPWPELSVRSRLSVLRAARHELAQRQAELADAISPQLARTRADTLAAEILPLLAAAKFLEREAPSLLAPRRLGASGRPFWLAGVHSTVERVPLGRVLVIGPANYPLFLPGVQVLQALAAGNLVVWKPGLGGRAVAEICARALRTAGLPEGALTITGESVQDAIGALRNPNDKIFFTGSEAAGKAVLQLAAESATPVVAELSGCDAVIALPSADRARLLAALEFGMRLNGSATCMAPRRLFLVGTDALGWKSFVDQLAERLSAVAAVPLAPAAQTLLRELVQEALREGATLCGDLAEEGASQQPLVVLNAKPAMRIARADIFAPVLSVFEVEAEGALISAYHSCPYTLTVSIFGEERLTSWYAKRLTAGTALVNDLIAPTADPRLPFGGRRASGFGVTRGREGLLAMTAVKSVIVQRSKSLRHYQATTRAHEDLFSALIALSHGKGLGERWAGLRRMMVAGKTLANPDLAKKLARPAKKIARPSEETASTQEKL